MSRTRASFKYALRYCQAHKEQLQADACARSCTDMDAKKFWKNVSRMADTKATNSVNVIGDAIGEVDICNMWREHFSKLYNCVPDCGDKQLFFDRVSGIGVCSSNCISVRDVIDAITGQKKSKSPGPNGLHMEAFLYGGLRLYTHLSIFYSICIRHEFLPRSFMDITIVPLVKNKGGDLTDMNNYRAIAMSNVDSKIFEKIILRMVTTATEVDTYQFGFRTGHSTTLCAGVLKQSVGYYINNGSHVFACFVDFSKAFDSVDYWKLFSQLLDDGAPSCVVRLLAYWYSNQLATVYWQSVISVPFAIGNGTKQGGVLSPYLFTRYIRLLLHTITSCRVGCNIGGLAVNILAYADDIVLLAPSWSALQEMLAILSKCCHLLNLTCNFKKTVCMNFLPKDSSKVVSSVFPDFKLDGHVLQFVKEFRYLGHIITDRLKDNVDILRELRKAYIRINILFRRFKRCSVAVKLRLFRCYYVCFYGAPLWKYYTQDSIKKLKSCYYKCMKIFFNYPRSYSVTAMLLDLSLPSFDTVVFNSSYTFSQQWMNSSNRIIIYMNQLGLLY